MNNAYKVLESNNDFFVALLKKPHQFSGGA